MPNKGRLETENTPIGDEEMQNDEMSIYNNFTQANAQENNSLKYANISKII